MQKDFIAYQAGESKMTKEAKMTKKTAEKGLVGKVWDVLTKHRNSLVFDVFDDFELRLLVYVGVVGIFEPIYLFGTYGPRTECSDLNLERYQQNVTRAVRFYTDRNHDGSISPAEREGLDAMLDLARDQYNRDVSEEETRWQ